MIKSIPIILAILLSMTGIIILSVAPSPADSFTPEVENLRQEIITLDRTRQSATFESKQGQLSEQEKKSTQQYINYLDSRITSLCAGLLVSAGVTTIADLPCPSSDTLLPGYQIPAAQTSGEQVDDLNQKLLESLGKFDDMLLDEQQKISARSKSPSGHYGAEDGDSGGNGQDGGEYSGANGSSGNQGQGQNQSPEGSTEAESKQQGEETTSSGQNGAGKGTGKSVNSSGAGGGKKPAPTPPIADDDDIVARQLREAAENETDPELKKRLWEEYKKYKEEVN